MTDPHDPPLPSPAGSVRDREADALADAALADLRHFVAAHETPDLRRAVMRRIAHSTSHRAPERPLGRFARAVRALWQPREFTLRLRPVYGMVGTAAVLLLIAAIATPPAHPDPHPLIAQEGRQEDTVRQVFFVQFRVQLADAADVRLAGTFTGWEPSYTMHEANPGVWTILLPLPQGVHDYAFLVDGQRWIPDPDAPGVADGFGGTNSRIALLAPGEEPRS